ncbi:unnamed protein product [Closterium sp. NIES-53]
MIMHASALGVNLSGGREMCVVRRRGDPSKSLSSWGTVVTWTAAAAVVAATYPQEQAVYAAVVAAAASLVAAAAPVAAPGHGLWTRRSPLSRAVSPEPRRSHYHADGPFHLVLHSRVPPPLILPQPPGSSLTVFHDPLSDYLRASHLVVSKVQPTPLAVDHGLTAPHSDEPFESSGPYPELVGCLMLAKYVASTSGMGLVLGGKKQVTLTGYSDSSWADDAELLRSTQDYCFSLGTGAVSWRSTRASSVSSSSCETEVYAAAMAAQELRWLPFLLTNLGERPCSPPVLFADNRSAVLLCEEP